MDNPASSKSYDAQFLQQDQEHIEYRTTGLQEKALLVDVYSLNRLVASQNRARMLLIWWPMVRTGMIGGGPRLGGRTKGAAERVA